MKMRWLGVVLAAGAVVAVGQDAAFSTTPGAFHSDAELRAIGAKLLEKAAKGSGSATETMEHYPGHFLGLTARTKSGGGEMHARWSDVFTAVDGEAIVLVGGTLEDRKDVEGGESRGTRVIGGTPYTLHKGDVLHISPGVAHQTTVPAGKTFIYFVVKAEVPNYGK